MTSNKAFVLPLRNKHIKWIQRHVLKYPGIRDTIELLENAVLNELETPFEHLGRHNIILSFIEKAVNSSQEREQNSGTNLRASILKSLHEVGKSLNEINNVIVQSENESHTDCDISRITHLLCQNVFVSDLFECLHEEDITIINSYLKDVILGTKLGLSAEFLLKLPDTYIYWHSSLIDWIALHIQGNYEEFYWKKSSSKKVLIDMGFSKESSLFIKTWIEKNPVMSHKSLLHWVTLYLETKFRDFLEPMQSALFIYQNWKTNEWIEVWSDIMEEKLLVRNLYSFGYKDQVKSLISELSSDLNSDECFWYHGTSQNAAQSLICNGIDLSFGNEGDFSKNGSGFYLVSKFDHALDYAKAKAFNDGKIFALLVFKLSKLFFKKYNGIDLTYNKDLWNKTVKYYNNYRINITPENGICKVEPQEVRGLDHIEGPASIYANGELKCSDIHQLCLRSTEIADCFTGKLAYTIFLK